jgi:tetratricopeptide (TPR) repeat protein
LLEAEALRLQAGILLEAGEVEPSQHLFEAALAIYQERGDLLSESTVLHNLGLVTRRRGDFATAQRYYEQALVARQAIGYRQGEALTLNNLGAIASDQGDMTRSLQYKLQALAISRQIGDRYVEMMALINLGIDTHDQGAYEQSQPYYEQALALCVETGNRRLEGITRQMMTLLLYHRSEFAAALQSNDEFATVAASLNDHAMINYVWLNRGHILSRMQRWAEAEAAYERAMTGWEGDLFIFKVEGKAGLARLYLAQGELAQACEQVAPILDFLAAGNQLDGLYEPFQVYLTCYEVLLAHGEKERGRELLNTSHTLLQQRAAQISDPAMRDSFLNNVTAHRRIVEVFQSGQ